MASYFSRCLFKAYSGWFLYSTTDTGRGLFRRVFWSWESRAKKEIEVGQDIVSFHVILSLLSMGVADGPQQFLD